MFLVGALEHPQQQVAGPCRTRGSEQLVERVEPLTGFFRVDVRQIRCDASRMTRTRLLAVSVVGVD